MRRVFIVFGLLLAPLPSAAAEPGRGEILSYARVEPGMKGTGKTVLRGDRAESFEVEILGKVDRIGPGQNLIVVRLQGATLAATGVLEGMSGSPVYVNGKLIGAIAYSWPFAREPIAGITPIEEMLAIPEAVPAGAPSAASAPRREARASREIRTVRDLLDPLKAAARYDALLGTLLRRAGAGAVPPLGLPVSASGLSRTWLAERLPPEGSAVSLGFRGPGWPPGPAATPAATGEGPPPGGSSQTGSGARASETGRPPGGPPLEAGDAVGAQLVQGDIDFTAIGTVTSVDGDRVLAFGHPFLQLGGVDYPMVRARVATLLPSLESSFKMGAALEAVGAFFQDRASGLAGRLGARARTVPVRIDLQREGSPPRTFNYQVVDDPILTPVLLYLTLGGILETTQKGAGDASVEVQEGSVLLLDQDRKADLSDLYSGRTAVLEASATVGLITEALLQNDYEPVQIKGANLAIRYSDTVKRARITGAWADRRQVHPGERVILSVGLKPYREEETLETIAIEIPKELEPGRLTLHVGDALAVTRIEQSGSGSYLPLDLDQLLDLINTLRKSKALAVLGTRDEPSVLIGSEPLPNLPPSKSSLILHGDSRASLPILRSRQVLDEAIDTDYALEGYQRVDIEVVR